MQEQRRRRWQWLYDVRMKPTLIVAVGVCTASAAMAGERLVGRAHVVDGDTVVVGGIHVRLNGVAAPEVVHAGKPGEPGGDDARAFMVALTQGQTVVCNLTQERTWGRRVGYCYADGRDIAEELVRLAETGKIPR